MEQCALCTITTLQYHELVTGFVSLWEVTVACVQDRTLKTTENTLFCRKLYKFPISFYGSEFSFLIKLDLIIYQLVSKHKSRSGSQELWGLDLHWIALLVRWLRQNEAIIKFSLKTSWHGSWDYTRCKSEQQLQGVNVCLHMYSNLEQVNHWLGYGTRSSALSGDNL